MRIGHLRTAAARGDGRSASLFDSEPSLALAACLVLFRAAGALLDGSYGNDGARRAIPGRSRAPSAAKLAKSQQDGGKEHSRKAGQRENPRTPHVRANNMADAQAQRCRLERALGRNSWYIRTIRLALKP